MSENYQNIELVYLGIDVNFGSGSPKKYYAYIEPERVEDYLAHSPVYKSKSFKRQLAKVSIGSIIKCQATINENNIAIHGTPAFSGRVDYQTTLYLETRSEANKTLFESEVERKASENFSAMEKTLAPIKEAYSKLPVSRRRAFVAWLLVYLNG
jgi:hypothetical protein